MRRWGRIDKDDAFIEAALAEANPMVLRVLLRQIGDNVADEVAITSQPGDNGRDIAVIKNPSDVELLRDRMSEYLRRSRDEGFEFPTPPMDDRATLHTWIEMAMGTRIPIEDLEFWVEESGLEPMMRAVDWSDVPIEDRQRFTMVIIGAGFAGLYAAIQLKRAGIPFAVLEKNAGAGGTWYENVYPGIRVDVPSQVYSYSFEPYYPWKHEYAPQQELAEYIEYVIDKYEIRSQIQFETEVAGASWDESRHVWQIELCAKDGITRQIEATGIISAVGILNRPKLPQIEGVAEFQGPTMHTARWDNAVELQGKRVAVIGTGSSGVQLTPDLAPLVDHLSVFQRSAAWVVSTPHYRDPLSEYAMWLYEAVPFYANWARLSVAYSYSEYVSIPAGQIDSEWSPDSLSVNARNEQVRQYLTNNMLGRIGHRPDLVAKCTPDYPPGAKRLVKDNGWFDALLRDNVELVTEPIDRISRNGIVLRNGNEVPFDVLVFATGFRASDFLYPMKVVGRDGLTLEEFWSKDGARAYLGMMMPHFPNLWCLYGPNSNPRSGNPILQAENATRYVMGCLKHMAQRDVSSVEVSEEDFAKYQERLDEALSTAIWNDKRQSSYYRNDTYGRIDVMTPWGATEYWKLTAKVDPDPLIFSGIEERETDSS
jgi:4-hydroxyacetophenone monooxygenase